MLDLEWSAGRDTTPLPQQPDVVVVAAPGPADLYPPGLAPPQRRRPQPPALDSPAVTGPPEAEPFVIDVGDCAIPRGSQDGVVSLIDSD